MSLPAGAPAGAWKPVDGFQARFARQGATGTDPALNDHSLTSDHTRGTAHGFRTPTAMIAVGDQPLGQLVDTIGHSAIGAGSAVRGAPFMGLSSRINRLERNTATARSATQIDAWGSRFAGAHGALGPAAFGGCTPEARRRSISSFAVDRPHRRRFVARSAGHVRIDVFAPDISGATC